MKRIFGSLLLVLLLQIALSAYAQTPVPTATPTSVPTATPVPTMLFSVRPGINVVIDPNGIKYWVVDGTVELPVGTWYAPLIANGTLTLRPSSFIAGEITADKVTADNLVSEKADLVMGSMSLLAGNVLTVTEGMTITLASPYQPLIASKAVTTSIILAGDAGQVAVLMNTGSDVITLSDTGTLKLSGNIALEQYDTLTLVSDGTNWIQLATSNN